MHAMVKHVIPARDKKGVYTNGLHHWAAFLSCLYSFYSTKNIHKILTFHWPAESRINHFAIGIQSTETIQESVMS